MKASRSNGWLSVFAPMPFLVRNTIAFQYIVTKTQSATNAGYFLSCRQWNGIKLGHWRARAGEVLERPVQTCKVWTMREGPVRCYSCPANFS